MDKHNKMLIDATHPEETRVVVLRNGRVEEFDYESAARKLLRGNIYLAKVTRVEPSLQAAFVDYGGNRHGFLAFSEIHPDYYQIPVADREILKREEAEEEARAEAEADERARSRSRRHGSRGRSGSTDAEQPAFRDADGDGETSEQVQASHDIDDRDAPASSYDDPVQNDRDDRSLEHDAPTYATASAPRDDYVRDSSDADSDVEGVIEVGSGDNGNGDTEQVEDVSTEEDALEEVPERSRRRARQYKIQEVIKRRQIILVQVVKEERGNKGAALTTYISLAGRYTVLMPNTGRGGGISRKITQPQDRKRLKAIAEELDVPEGMGLIIRTAGAARTKQEIKRDYEYLLRLWESVRELTLTSTAPCLVYEEGNLIKRSIRDLYSKEIDQVVVAGAEACGEAQDFMGMLMPGHAENVIAYDGLEPLFTRFGIERQLNAMFSPYVTLRSGGYLVINQTEALVAIDVNSGKSTREFSIEETAYATNCEAAEEIARQLKLRDLAGLIVIDFIDMEENRNNRTVERRMKDALRHDRARIQIGRISHFGLLEMSRQRMRTGVLEGSTTQCPHCQGTGIIRSTESVALAVLRGLEDTLLKQPASLMATTTPTVALYILNHKRAFITDMEARHGITIAIEGSDRMQGANFAVEKTAAPIALAKPTPRSAVSMDWGFDGASSADDDAIEEEAPRETARPPRSAARDDAEPAFERGRDRDRPRDTETREGAEGGSGRKRRRRRGRRDRDDSGSVAHRDDRFVQADADRDPDHAPARDIGADDDISTIVEDRAPIAASDWPVERTSNDPHEEVGDEADRPEAAVEGGDRDDRPRRGRRRGRRGGRGRGREQSAERSPSLDGAPAENGAAGEWHAIDVSRPGAEQPPPSADPRFDTGWQKPVTAPAETDTAFRRAAPRSDNDDRPSATVRSDRGDEPSPQAPAIARVPEHRPYVVETDRRPAEGTRDAPAAPVSRPSEAAPAYAAMEPSAQPAAQPPPSAPASPPRKGWWQRNFG